MAGINFRGRFCEEEGDREVQVGEKSPSFPLLHMHSHLWKQ
jgi:hypothetical protein